LEADCICDHVIDPIGRLLKVDLSACLTHKVTSKGLARPSLIDIDDAHLNQPRANDTPVVLGDLVFLGGAMARPSLP
jgi:hypothetical protein